MFIKGKNINLIVVLEEGEYPEWCNNQQMSEGSQLGRLPLKNTKQNDNNNLILSIVQNKTLIGRVSLEDINLINRTAELKIFIQPNCQGSGYGEEACELIMKHGFEELGLNRIDCGTLENNVGMQKLAFKLGFKEEGRRKGKVFKHNSFIDVIEYGLLKDDFYGSDDKPQEG